ncbi:MAG: PH domain-containing protein [Acidimicrobiia bacterium]
MTSSPAWQGPPASERRRLHPAAALLWWLKFVWQAGLALFIGVVVLPVHPALVLGAGAILTLAGAGLRYFGFTYRLEEGALILEGGIFARWERVLPKARIQSVDVVRKLRHLLLGVAEVRVEAAGGTTTEAILTAVSVEDAERLRRLLLARPEGEPGQAVPSLVSLGPGALLVAGLTGGRVAVLAAILGSVQEALPGERLAALVEGVLLQAQARGTGGVLLVLALLAALLLLAVLVSLVTTVVVYWDFTVRREGDRLVIERGLLGRRRAFIPLGRVQGVRVHENLLRRWLRLASATLVVAGYAHPGEERQRSGMLLPVGPRAEALGLARRLVGPQRSVTLEPPSGGGLARRLVYAVAVALAAALALLDWIGYAGLLFLPVAAGLAFGWWRALGHAHVGKHVVVRSGLAVRATTFVPVANIQHLRLTAGPLQRALGVATVRAAIPRAEARAVDLPRRRAERRFMALARALSSKEE